jgi:hypothetical protein
MPNPLEPYTNGWHELLVKILITDGHEQSHDDTS